VNGRNYDDVVRQLREAGLEVDVLDIGHFRRVRVRDAGREKRGWYHLHELTLDTGGSLIVGSFGVWRGNDSGTTKVKLRRDQVLSDAQQLAMRERLAADRKAADLQRKQNQARAAARAQAMWQRLEPDGQSEYLARKQVAPHGVRFSRAGAVVLPLLDVDGRVHGLQAIYPRGHVKAKRLERDKDFWPAGLAKQGHFFPIGSPAGASICLLAEGYATAASAFEALQIPAVVCFDAGNIGHVAAALRARWPGLRLLVLADDDYMGRCRQAGCGQLTLVASPECQHCGKPHGASNAGVSAAQAAGLIERTSWVAPRFTAERPLNAKGPSDFNDLHCLEGLHVVRAQVEAHLTAIGWSSRQNASPPASTQGGGGGAAVALQSIQSLDELLDRYALVYEAAETVFDSWEHKLVPLASMRNLCVSRQLHRAWMESPTKRIARIEEVGFDPGESDPAITCNMWSGWPTTPKSGSCARLLELGEYLCSLDPRAGEMWRWLQCWLAYPIQHPGAKMKSAVIMHGPQGTGKNLFFEAVLGIYGTYGQVVDQDAIEDKYNDFMSRKLMLVADEVVARQEMFHAKNKLKGLVTSDSIWINPKFVARYRERNHVQVVFLSNEVQPMALERDDRRYAVIWTPTKWETDMYNAVLAEIRGGGVAALHHHLLHLDLGDFGPATLPPMTQAKRDLIELGMDSSERFYIEWSDRHLPLCLSGVRTEDLYAAYRHWCSLQGIGKPAQLNTCVGAWKKRPGVLVRRDRHFLNHSLTREVQSMVLYPASSEQRLTREQLTASINEFKEALSDWRKVTSDHIHSRSGRGPSAKDGSDAGEGGNGAPF
jgi:putative DNA primase/helicase